MSMENRTSSAMFKRAEQLRRWEESETNLEEAEPKLSSRKIKFSKGCVFLAACAASDKDEVLRLLDEKADVDTANIDGLTALHQACIDDNLDMVEFLVAHGADVNRGDNEGWTPLHATASCGFVSIAKFLIDHGADVAAVNNDGELPVDIAESSSMDDILHEIIEAKGIDCEEARNREERLMLEDAKAWVSGDSVVDPMKPHPKTGATALHVAAAKGYIKVLDLLLQGIADNIDTSDLDGWTAFHAAAHWGQKEAAEILVQHFCDMDAKNCVGQTADDVADSDMRKVLQDLRTKQAALQKDRPPPNNLTNRPLNSSKRRSSISRLSGSDKTNLISKDATSERQILDRTIAEEPKQVQLEVESEKEDLSGSTDDSQVDDTWTYDDETCDTTDGTESEEEEMRNKANREDTRRIPSQPVEVSKPPISSPTEEDTWRRPAPVKARGDAQPPKNLTLHIEPAKPPPGRVQPTNQASDVVLRRTHSFEADQKFYRRYMELQARIANSCPSLNPGTGPSPPRLPARSASLRERQTTRRGLRDEGKGDEVRSPGVVTPPPPTPTTASRTVSSPPVQVGVRSPAKVTVTPATPTPVQSPPTATPTTPGGTKLSPGNIFKNFFKSFVPPVRDDESETQRKAHAKRVRETRRSTQGVTLEEIKSAEELVKKKNQQLNSSEQSSAATITSTAAPPPVSTEELRRPYWRLKVDSNCKFLLEDARSKAGPAESAVPQAARRTTPTSPDAESDATVTLSLPRPGSQREDDRDAQPATQSSQAVIQRRRKPKRRSTGVVHVDMDDLDPERHDSGGPEEESQNGGSEGKSRVGSVSSLASSQPEENGELDYKKLYEEEHAKNEVLRDRLRKTEGELTQVMSSRTPMSETEKRERRAMERKLSEMEEELKQLQKLKAENERLKAENRALTRVVSKLTNSNHK